MVPPRPVLLLRRESTRRASRRATLPRTFARHARSRTSRLTPVPRNLLQTPPRANRRRSAAIPRLAVCWTWAPWWARSTTRATCSRRCSSASTPTPRWTSREWSSSATSARWTTFDPRRRKRRTTRRPQGKGKARLPAEVRPPRDLKEKRRRVARVRTRRRARTTARGTTRDTPRAFHPVSADRPSRCSRRPRGPRGPSRTTGRRRRDARRRVLRHRRQKRARAPPRAPPPRAAAAPRAGRVYSRRLDADTLD